MVRPWSPADAGGVLKAFDHPTMSTQIDRVLDTLGDAEEWVAAWTGRWTSGEAYSWAVADETGLLGSITVSSIDRRHEIAWISYWTCASARGRGVASAALRAVSDWAFHDLGLFRLELGHRTNNPASCRVAIAAGYAVEGLERQKLRYDDDRFDVELHARLATDR